MTSHKQGVTVIAHCHWPFRNMQRVGKICVTSFMNCLFQSLFLNLPFFVCQYSSSLIKSYVYTKYFYLFINRGTFLLIYCRTFLLVDCRALFFLFCRTLLLIDTSTLIRAFWFQETLSKIGLGLLQTTILVWRWERIRNWDDLMDCQTDEQELWDSNF